MTWCILIPLLVGAICALLGYLLGKLCGGKCTNCEDKIKQLEADLASCRAKTGLTLIPFNASAAKAVFGRTIKENDLTVIEGIGPKIQELFHENNIKTWKALSESSVTQCQQILDKGGERFTVHKPNTWPKQARLAYEGKWQELFDWQEKLDGGVE